MTLANDADDAMPFPSIREMLAEVAQAARSGNAHEEDAAVQRNAKLIVEILIVSGREAFKVGMNTAKKVAEEAERLQEESGRAALRALLERLGLHPLHRLLEDLDPELRSLFEQLEHPQEEH
jgi:hypothetical protein